MIVFNYFKSCLKRNIRFLPAALVFSVILSVLLAVVFSTSFNVDEEKIELPKRVGVGLVGDIENKRFQTGLGAVKLLDASKDYLDFITYENEDDAAKAIKKGEILGYLIVPDGFIKSVINGENTPATFVSKNSLVDLLPVIVNDVVGTVSNLVVESQVGIFAMENFYLDNELANRKKDLNEINLKYISFVISRNEMVEVTEVGSTGKVSIKGYYTCVILVLLVLLIGVMCASVCIKKNLSLPRLLATRGCGALSQTFSDFLAFVAIPLGALSVLGVVLLVFFRDKAMIVPELGAFYTSELVLLFVRAIPAFLLIGALQFFVYELCSDVISGTLLQFVVSLGLAYVSGCIYPVGFFPESVQVATKFMPVGASFEYLKKLLVQTADSTDLFAVLAYSFALVLLSALVRRIKIRSRLS